MSIIRTALVVLALAVTAVTPVTIKAQVATWKEMRDVKRVKCSFSVFATGTWDAAGTPKGDLKPATLEVSYDTIDTEDGTARVNGLYGPQPIIAKLSIWSLHFLQVGSEGSLRMTTVFDKESRPGHFRAVHTIHEHTPISLPGFASRPEQYYGECTVER